MFQNLAVSRRVTNRQDACSTSTTGKMPVPQELNVVVGWASSPPKSRLLPKIMCGRFTLNTPAKIIAELFKLSEIPDIKPRYNIAPSQSIATVTVSPEKNQRQFQFMRWGLIPSWAKDMKIASHTINARSETVAEKPAFRSAIKHRRCLIIADGFYEWQPQGKKKQPYYFTMANSEPFAFAGLWESWESPEAEKIVSCSIITTAANETVQPVHDRMPVILPDTAWEEWLDPAVSAQQVLSLLKPYTAAAMTANAVSTIVNSPTKDSPECIQAMPLSLGG